MGPPVIPQRRRRGNADVHLPSFVLVLVLDLVFGSDHEHDYETEIAGGD
jgi:hypothetical protein